MVEKLWEGLGAAFTIKDLGLVDYALKTKIEIDKKNDVIKFSNGAYIKEVLARYDIRGGENVHTPQLQNDPIRPEHWTKLSKEEQKQNIQKYPVRQFIGCCWWMVQKSRPDIRETCQEISRYLHQPTKQLWKSAYVWLNT